MLGSLLRTRTQMQGDVRPNTGCTASNWTCAGSKSDTCGNHACVPAGFRYHMLPTATALLTAALLTGLLRLTQLTYRAVIIVPFSSLASRRSLNFAECWCWSLMLSIAKPVRMRWWENGRSKSDWHHIMQISSCQQPSILVRPHWLGQDTKQSKRIHRISPNPLSGLWGHSF